VVVQKVEVATGQPIDLRERIVDALGIEGPAAVEERVLVTEVAMLWTPAGDDDGVWDQVAAAFDQVAPDWRNPIQRAAGGRDVSSRRRPAAEVLQELRKRLLPRSKKDRVGVSGSFFRQRCHMESAECHERSAGAIGIREPVRATGVRDVDLNHHQVRPVVELQGRDVLVFEHGLIVRRQIGGEGREAERRKQ